MKQIISHLRKNWIKYGFETFAILIGILGAQYLSNLNDNIKEKDTESEYLTNLILELESQAATTESQISFETHSKEVCETLLDLIYEAPYDVDLFNQEILELSRKTYLVSNAVFEDMKNSGHISIISDPEIRYELFQFYQQTEYVEAVISKNNAVYADEFSGEVQHLMVADLAVNKDFALFDSLNMSLDVRPFPNARQIIDNQLGDDKVRLQLHNLLTIRGRVCSLHLTFLANLLKENQNLLTDLKEQLQAKS